MNSQKKDPNSLTHSLKKPYSEPLVQVYGSLTQMTSNVMNGTPDHINPQGSPAGGTR